jgi:hypothetical protein
MTRTPKRPRDPNLMRTGRLGGPAVSRMDGSPASPSPPFPLLRTRPHSGWRGCLSPTGATTINLMVYPSIPLSDHRSLSDPCRAFARSCAGGTSRESAPPAAQIAIEGTLSSAFRILLLRVVR